MALPPSRRLTRPAGAGTDPNLQPLFENLEILNGARGNGMDRAVLLRDLVDLGVATMRKSGTGVFVPAKPDAGTGNGGDGGIVEPPEQPRGVTANGGFSTILIDWEKPKYLGHAYTEVLRSATDNFSTAVRIATTTANLQSDQVGGDKVYFYWVRFVNLLDVKGPVQSTNGVRGETQADIGEILDKLKGQVDESFLTPSFNSKLVNMKDLTDQIPDLARDFGDLSINVDAISSNVINIVTDISGITVDVGDLTSNVSGIALDVVDLSVKLTDELIRLDGEIVDISESKFNMLAEATLEAALGVDNEGYTRRKATAEINVTQKALVTQTGSMAQQILEVSAKVDQDSAIISENKTSIVRLDESTKLAIESITQKLDVQESVIGENTANISENNQTIIRIDGDLSTLDSSITSITGMLTEQRSDIDGNTATITSNSQTIVTQGSKIDQTIADLGNFAEGTNSAISAITTKVENQQSEIDLNSSSINSIDQTVVIVGRKVDENSDSIDGVIESVTAISDRLTTQESAIGSNTATISDHSQTLVQQGGLLNSTIADLTNLKSGSDETISSLSSRITSQKSEIDENKASIETTNTTITVVNGKVDKNSGDINTANAQILSISDSLTVQQSEIDGSKATISEHSQTLVQQNIKLNDAISGLANIAGPEWDGIETIVSLSSKIDEQRAEIDDSKASITTNSQAIVIASNKADSNESAIGGLQQDLISLTDIVTTQSSDIGENKAVITQQSQTLVQQGGQLSQAISDIVNISGMAESNSQSVASLTSIVNSQKSDIDGNTANIETNSQTLVVIGDAVTSIAQKTDEISATADIFGEAVMEAATGIDREAEVRRTATAKIKLTQTAIVNDLAAQAKQVLEISAKVGENSAGIVETKNAVIELDAETKQAISSLTQNISEQKSQIDNNTAGIVESSTTLVSVKADIENAKADIISVTDKSVQQDAKIDGNTASITSNTQTLVQQGGKIDKAIADIAALPDNSEAIISLTQKVDSQESSIDNNAANIETNTKTLVIVGETITSLSQRTDEISATNDIVNEAALEAATAVDREAEVRRTATAKIKLTQTAIVNDVAAQAKQVLELTAKVGENSAGIVETKNAVVQIDTETKQAIASLTQITDEQRSEIDGNIASINQSNQTLAMLDQELYGVKQDVISVTESITQQQSEIDGNKANITSQAQTIVTIDDKVNSNTATINVVSESLNQLQSTVEDNTASIITNNQTIVTVDNKANATNAAVSSLSQQMTTLTSELGTTKSQVTQNSQTIATINADGSSAYLAQWGVKASVGDITAGIGLTVKKVPGQPDVSQCTVIADQFSVGYTKTDGSGDTVYPFFVGTNPSTGLPGVFIDTAFIKAAKIQDLVAGEVVADNIKVGATLTAPYIKGGKIEIGSRFTVDENGNMVANNATLASATVSGIINANGGVFNNVTIQENCDVKGTVYANKIVGDIYRAISISVPKKSNIFDITLVANGFFETQNYARRLQFPSLSLYGYGVATAYYYVNDIAVASQQFTISDNIVGTATSNAYPRAGVNSPPYVYTMPPNVSGTFEIRLEINRRLGGNVERISEVYDQVVVFGLFKV